MGRIYLSNIKLTLVIAPVLFSCARDVINATSDLRYEALPLTSYIIWLNPVCVCVCPTLPYQHIAAPL